VDPVPIQAIERGAAGGAFVCGDGLAALGEGGAEDVQAGADHGVVHRIAGGMFLDAFEIYLQREIATVEKIDRGYMGNILRLTLLAPDIVEAILDRRQSAGLGLPALLKPFPVEWERQRDEIRT
jgi:hypothetical protein